MGLGLLRHGTEKKTFFIHIGFHKTGTTAIQQFLHANRRVLGEKGFLYPGKNVAHHEIGWAILGEDGSRGTAGEHRTEAGELSREIRKSPLRNVIISTETLCKSGRGIPSAIRDFIREASGGSEDVRIIAYVRRQDYWLDSWYRENVKNIRSRTTKTFPEFRAEFDENLLDFYRRLVLWREVFGAENMCIRTYESSALHNGIFRDFLGIAGLDLTGDFVLPSDQESNISLDRERVEIMRLCNKYAGADTRLHMFVVKRLGEIRKRETPSTRYYLSPAERISLLRKFGESNRKVALEFLKREDGILFSDPWPDPDEAWEPFTGLSPEVRVGTFMEILLNMKSLMKSAGTKPAT
jgi:hypothetical protein